MRRSEKDIDQRQKPLMRGMMVRLHVFNFNHLFCVSIFTMTGTNGHPYSPITNPPFHPFHLPQLVTDLCLSLPQLQDYQNVGQ